MLPAHGVGNGTILFRREQLATYPGPDLLREEERLFARDENRKNNAIPGLAEKRHRTRHLTGDVPEGVVRDNSSARHSERQSGLNVLHTLIHDGQSRLNPIEASGRRIDEGEDIPILRHGIDLFADLLELERLPDRQNDNQQHDNDNKPFTHVFSF